MDQVELIIPVIVSIHLSQLEFLLATINIPEMLTKEKLRIAFNIFDPDGSGEITIAEIQAVLGGAGSKEEEEAWKAILLDIDKDGNGEISFEEFVIMMQTLTKNHKK